MTSVLSAVFWGALVLSVLVFFHEGGHYLAARAFGVRVTEFFLGMPCRAKISHKSRSHGTEIGVTPVLLGGYTRICGMDGQEDPLLAQALACVQAHGRVEASALATELGIDEGRAYGLLATLADWAAIRPYYDAEKGERPGQSDWPEAFEALMRDSELRTEYDRGHDFLSDGVSGYGEPRPVPDAEAFLASERSRTYLGCGFWRRFGMLAAGPLVNILLAFLLVVGSLTLYGTEVYSNSTVVGSVTEGSLAEEAGVVAGDTILAVDGEDVSGWDELHDALQVPLQAGADFTVTLEHEGERRTVAVDLADGEATDLFGISPSTEMYRLSVPQASALAVRYAALVGEYALRLIMPQHTMEVLSSSSSIVGISVQASEAASLGLGELVLFMAAISMSLGFMNLLPIPPLDGGKILIEVIQAIMRRPLSRRAQAYLSYAGLAFFLFVFVFVLRNDISSIING